MKVLTIWRHLSLCEVTNSILTGRTEVYKNIVNKQVRFNLETEINNIDVSKNSNNENNDEINEDEDNDNIDFKENDDVKQQLQQTNLYASEREEYIKYKQNKTQTVDKNVTKPDVSDATNYTKQIYEASMVPKLTATFPTNQAT